MGESSSRCFPGRARSARAWPGICCVNTPHRRTRPGPRRGRDRPAADRAVQRRAGGELAPTEIAQPAIVATSLAVLEVLRDQAGFVPAVVAGHSLGEYPALVAAGVLEAEAALRLVRRRGELMAGVSRQAGGAMTAVLGLAAARIEEICADCAPWAWWRSPTTTSRARP